MAQFHFVEDYEAHVKELLRKHPRDEAMSLAVGGSFREIGEIEERIVRHAGLRDGMLLIDLGCGSGRLAHVLSESMRIEYLGIDVVQSLLDFAKSKSESNYKFAMSRELHVPAAPASADMICAFSLFTHLLHEESYLYLESMHKVLKTGGKVVFSFLEFGLASNLHWPVFDLAVNSRRTQTRLPLSMFIERDAIRVWCQHLNFEIEEIIDGSAAPYGGSALGQSVAILRSRA